MYRKMLITLSVAVSAVALVLLGTAPTAWAGGWSTVTLDHVPTSFRAEEPVTLGFMVRQHGVTPIRLEQTPSLVIQNGSDGEEIRFQARPGEEVGQYWADVRFPHAGEWTWRAEIEPFPLVELGPITVEPAVAPAAVVSRTQLYASLAIVAVGLTLAFWRGSVRRWQGFAIGALTVAALIALLAGSPAPFTASAAAEPASAAYGRMLFAAKGCTTCHLHEAVPTHFSVQMGPDLTHYAQDAEFVRAWLRDPQAVRASTTMPNPQLSETEIKALTAFLSEST